MSEDKKEENSETPETKAEATEISETETKVEKIFEIRHNCI